ncbi:glycosyltransferase family 2 protein (plasmid) [Cupriavidus pinatubonensis]|uniref:glycosyltransferase family 2 protein n=1 Tax=Cupriavidus pinatubonensis TaxID=248026 RepID=UPI001C737EAC|nr:glycosyltransferase family 2 protein [Cupriavidus pinatubonensis]QYY34183.1 glycosyltransferase family 2 protein [Cupriavidus pinatubonensis]
MTNSKHGISILILTKNEEQDLPGCLQSVAWSDDIHVFDSGSTDQTVDVAQQFGATVSRRTYNSPIAFGGDEASHRNWGLQNLPFKHPWVFCIDADERMTAALVQNLIHAVESATVEVAFSVRRRDFYMGTWLRHVQASPYYLRLFRPEKMRYERLINPILIPDGPTAEIPGYLDHFPFSKGLYHWISRHNNYSTLEAKQIIENRRRQPTFRISKAFTCLDFHQRRFHQKEIFYRLPMRPLMKFLILYFGKRGFLDGRAGFTYATLQSIYEYFIALKTQELSSEKLAQHPTEIMVRE